MCKKDKTKLSCGEIINSNCVSYEGELLEDSVLEGECPSVQEVIEEVIEKVEEAIEEPDYSLLGKSCIGVDPNIPNQPTLYELLEAYEFKICDLDTKLTLLQDKINDFGIEDLDYKCLKDPCDNTPTTLKEGIQILIDRECECGCYYGGGSSMGDL